MTSLLLGMHFTVVLQPLPHVWRSVILVNFWNLGTPWVSEISHCREQIIGRRQSQQSGALVTDLFKNLTGIPQVQVDDLSNDDNGQDLTNYNFATDGFRMVTTPTNDVYLATAGTFILPQQWPASVTELWRALMPIEEVQRAWARAQSPGLIFGSW